MLYRRIAPRRNVAALECSIGLLAVAVFAGCGGRPPASSGPPAHDVVVSKPVVQTVPDFRDFSGTTEAKPTVEIRAQVTGYLDKVFFREGSLVKRNDPLFLIDPRTYRAALHSAEATLAQDKAILNLARTELARAEPLKQKNAIAGTEYDQAKNAVEVAEARVALSKAAVETAKLNVDFCSINSPIDGRISRQLIDPGNVVLANQTALTTIVSMDPMYAHFDPDERTVLEIRRLIRAGKVKSAMESTATVHLGLADEEGFPHEGTIDFVDNRLDPTTGTLRLRAKFPNPKHLVAPGLFVRVRLPLGDAHPAILVPERALGMDQSERVVYVVGADDTVVCRRVAIGGLYDGFRVIVSGLGPNERVVVEGQQGLRPGGVVHVKSAESVSAAKAGPTMVSDPPATPGPTPAAATPQKSKGNMPLSAR